MCAYWASEFSEFSEFSESSGSSEQKSAKLSKTLGKISILPPKPSKNLGKINILQDLAMEGHKVSKSSRYPTTMDPNPAGI